MSKWYGDEDPFTKAGPVRLIVVRHNSDYTLHGRSENCTSVVYIEAFDMKLLCPTKEKSKHGSGPCLYWMREEIEGSCEHKINHLFKNLSNGLYELTGDLYHWSSQSYEGDWDGDSELRNTVIQEICFDHAMCFGNPKEGLYDNLERLLYNQGKFDAPYHSETDIHPYMTKHQILVNHANALTRIATNNYHPSTSYKDSKIEDLENCIHMLMLQIDSEKQDKYTLALEIDEKVRVCLKDHRKAMDPEF